MTQSARITSIDALQTAATALLRFRGECTDALDELELATRRALGWIRFDRREYWSREVRHSEEAVTRAQAELRKAKSTRNDADSPREASCAEEERALRRAQRRHEAAQQKLDAVRRWTRSVEHAIDEYQRNRLKFMLWLDGDLGKAVAALNRMSEALETYTSLEAPSAAAAGLSSSADSTVGQANRGTRQNEVGQ